MNITREIIQYHSFLQASCCNMILLVPMSRLGFLGTPGSLTIISRTRPRLPLVKIVHLQSILAAQVLARAASLRQRYRLTKKKVNIVLTKI